MVTAGRPLLRPPGGHGLRGQRLISTAICADARVARLPPPGAAGGTLIFMGGTGARHPAPGLRVAAATAAMTALTANLALEIAPVRVNLIAAGFVDTPLSASLLGDDLDERRISYATLPIRRVVGPADVAALAVHIMTNTALTGAAYDIDGGQQLIAGALGDEQPAGTGHQGPPRPAPLGQIARIADPGIGKTGGGP